MHSVTAGKVAIATEFRLFFERVVNCDCALQSVRQRNAPSASEARVMK